MQRPTYGTSLGKYLVWEETVPAWPAVLNSRFHVCTSLVPKPMTMVFCLGTKLRVSMRTMLENGILRDRTG